MQTLQFHEEELHNLGLKTETF